MSSEISQYDAIVIGSGQGGNPLAQKLAQRGERVALIERGKLGGTCVNTGCTPTKTMIASAQIAHYVREARRWGVHAGEVTVDVQAVLKRKREVVEKSRSSWESKVNGEGQPKLFRGQARFIGPKQIEVNGDRLEAKRIFIDTGAVAAIPPIEGLDRVPYLTNESILDLAEIPKQLLVLGSGYIGLEFGQMFRRFGSEVTVVSNGARILPREDDDITAELQKALEAEGIRFLLNAQAVAVAENNGGFELTVEAKSGPQSVTGSHLLVATGRTPQTKELQLEKTGVKIDEKGFIVVNERLETTAKEIWALGDVKGGPAFTHISYNDFQIIYGNLYEGKNLSTSTRLIPYAAYTDPELGRVGMTEREARAEGRRIKVGTMPMSSVSRAIERGETAGLMKVVIDADTDRILGAAILSSEGGELVQILGTLMLADKPYTLLKGAVYIHPTLAEGFFGLFESVKEVQEERHATHLLSCND